MGEKIQGFRRDFKRRVGNMGSGDLFSIISKVKPSQKQVASCPKIERAPSIISQSARDIPSISVIHDSWIPSAQPTAPLRVTNATPPMTCSTPRPGLVAGAAAAAAVSPSIHSPLVSPLMSPGLRSPLRSPLRTPLRSPFLERRVESPLVPEAATDDDSSLLNEDTPPSESFGSASTLEDSPLTCKEIALIERPLSTRYSGQKLENREKLIMTCDTVPEAASARFSKKDLMRPLPASPPISASASDNLLIKGLRQELVSKARELQEEKERLQSTVASIRHQYDQLNYSQCSSLYCADTTAKPTSKVLHRPSFPAFPDATAAAAAQPEPAASLDSGSLAPTRTSDSRLQWIEFESNRLKIENEILCKKVHGGKKLQQEMQQLKQENMQLSSELGHLQEINKRVIQLENDTVISNLESEFTACDSGRNTVGLGIRNIASSPPPSNHQAYRELQEQMADLQRQLLESTAEQRAEWDCEREQLVERIRLLEESELRTCQELEKERNLRIFNEQECLRAESSYSALYESLKQQKTRFQYQLKTIESKLMAIESASLNQNGFKQELSEGMVAQRDLFKGHRQLFQLQEHYMHILERLNAGMTESPTRSRGQSAQIQDALCTLRQFLPPVRSDDSPQISSAATAATS